MKISKRKKIINKVKAWLVAQNNIIDDQINDFDKTNVCLATENNFQGLELLSEVASEQKYLSENIQLNDEIIYQTANSFDSSDSNLNQEFKNILLS